MKLNLSITKSLGKRFGIAIAAFTILATGMTPALAGAAPAGTAGKPYNYCGLDSENNPAGKPTQKDTSKLSKANKARVEAKYSRDLAIYTARIPSCIVAYPSKKVNKVVITPVSNVGTNQPNSYKTAICNSKSLIDKSGKARSVQVPFIVDKAHPGNPLVIKCSAGNYTLTYVKKGTKQVSSNNANSVSVANQQHQCTFLKVSGVVDVQGIAADGTCPVDQASTDAQALADRTKATIAAVFTPSPVLRGAKATLTVTLSPTDPADGPFDFKDCAGTLSQTTTYHPTKGKDVIETRELNLRLNTKSTALNLQTKPGVCLYQARYTAAQTKSKTSIFAGTETITNTLRFKGANIQADDVTVTTKVQDKK